jgi:integrase
MSIRKDKASGIWHIDITVDGKRIQRSSGTSNRKAAKELEDSLRSQLWREQKLGELPRVTWEQLVVAYVEEKSEKRSIEDDKDKLRWLDRYFKGKEITEINLPAINDVLARKKATGVSNATVNRYAALLSTMMNLAFSRGWINGTFKIPKRNEQARSYRWLSRPEAVSLINELRPTAAHLAQMVRFSLVTGLRQSNVTHLQWSQIDLERRIAWVLPEHAKGKKTIAIPLNDSAIKILTEQQGQHQLWVFPYAGRPVINPANHAFKKAMARAGIENFRWHDLRHTWASWHVQSGTPLAVLQKLGGWSSYSMVLRYAHLAPDHIAEFASNIRFAEIGEDTVKPVEKEITDTAESLVVIGGAGGGRTHGQRIKSKVTD